MPGSMLKIEIKPLARNDLLGIWDYTFQEWGAAQADVYLQDLENAFSVSPKFEKWRFKSA